ncbi:fungal protein [Schizosaccharomyces japonicus yFS275]|uniref:Fungal protein n=1 Tax=Schizosaccharomyces japonicus (strain yFS275 / FY16936) TaxID=402676 RepID=B6K819_SCHJY|nr:fungal protein [Schizosaccharomyces japonicus yFS275]EEB09673.1 fungal protein [Schizosaccharomyces japonicus yFS275]
MAIHWAMYGVMPFLAGLASSVYRRSRVYHASRSLSSSGKNIADMVHSKKAVDMVNNAYAEMKEQISVQEHEPLFRSHYVSTFLSFRDGLQPVFKTFYDPTRNEWISVARMGKAMSGYQKMTHGGAIATLLIECLETTRSLSKKPLDEIQEPSDPVYHEDFRSTIPSYGIQYYKPISAGSWVLIRVRDNVATLYDAKRQKLAQAVDKTMSPTPA